MIRVARAADIEILTAAEPPGADVASRCFARQERGESVLLVAWRGDDPVGTGELLRGDVAEVRSLHVQPARRGRGYGTAMLRKAERLAQAWGATSLRLGVGLDNPDARRLYQRLGYTGTGEVETTTYTYVDDDGPHEATETAEWLVKDLRVQP